MHGMKPPRSIFLAILYVREPTSLVQLLYWTIINVFVYVVI
jgi:hypothetical protein